MISETTLTGRFHGDDKIIMFISMSVICLSFTILNNFENKKSVTLGIEWTITGQAEGQDGCILAKFLFPLLLTESRPIDSHLDRTSLVNKGFIIIYGQKDNIFSGKNERNPPPAWLANQNAGFV